MKKICGESNAVNLSDVNDWLTIKWPLLREGYEDKNIFNADETGLLFKMLPNRTLAFKGESCHGEKGSKERITVFLCASMVGEKRCPVIIGKYLRPRCFKNKIIKQFSYYANKNAWMKSDIFKEELVKWDSELLRKKKKNSFNNRQLFCSSRS